MREKILKLKTFFHMLTYNVIECFQIIIIPSKINYKFQKIERF